MKLRRVAAALLVLLLGTCTGQALQYDKVALGHASKILLIARGRITDGDTQRLLGFLLSLPASDRVAGIVVDSPGGGLVEAETLAGVIRRAGFPLFVPPGGQCSSACFLLFAAAPNRFVAANTFSLFESPATDETSSEAVRRCAVSLATGSPVRRFCAPADSSSPVR